MNVPFAQGGTGGYTNGSQAVLSYGINAATHQQAGEAPPRSPILYTNNNRPASGPLDGTAGSKPVTPLKTAGSKPPTPTLGEYLDPEALQKKAMQPGPGLLQRTPSHGRRASSASAGAAPAGGSAAGSKVGTPAGIAGADGAVARTPPRALSAGRLTPQMGGDALDAYMSNKMGPGQGGSRPPTGPGAGSGAGPSLSRAGSLSNGQYGGSGAVMGVQGMMGGMGAGSRPASNAGMPPPPAPIYRQASLGSGSRQGLGSGAGAGYAAAAGGAGGGAVGGSRPPSGAYMQGAPAEGALSAMPLPRSPSMPTYSRSNSAGRRTPLGSAGAGGNLPPRSPQQQAGGF